MTNTCTHCDESIRANAAGGWWHTTIDGEEVGPYLLGKDDHEPEHELATTDCPHLAEWMDAAMWTPLCKICKADRG